jgi:hypothetical protein
MRQGDGQFRVDLAVDGALFFPLATRSEGLADLRTYSSGVSKSRAEKR